MIIEEKKNFIRESLAILKANVQLDNAANLTSLSVLLENFICELLNLLNSYNLQNKNQTDSKFKFLDLYDSNNGYGVQVTAREDGSKIYETVRALNENNIYEVNRLIFVILGNKKKYKKIPESTYNVEIIDLEDLYKLIINSEKIDRACNLFKKYLSKTNNTQNLGLDYILYRTKIKRLFTINSKFILYFILMGVIFSITSCFYNLMLVTMALFFVLPMLLYYELKKRKFYRINDINLEIDQLNNVFIVKLSGDCLKCKSQEKDTLIIKRFKKENEEAYFKIACRRNEKLHLWDFDYTILGDIENDFLYKEK